MNLGINIMTVNVAGLISVVKRKQVARLIRQNRVDVVCLQKTYVKDGESKHLGQVLHGHIYHAFTSSRAKGVLVGIS